VIAKTCIAALLCCEFAMAQSPSATAPSQPATPKSAADALVDQLVENYVTLRATLPSLTAHETVETHATRGILWQNTSGEGTVRVQRNSSGGGLKETHDMTVVNGKPIAPDEQKAQAQMKKEPTQPANAFFGLQETFFGRRSRPCFSYTLAPQPVKDGSIELRFASISESATAPKCQRELDGLTGFARIDPATHQLTHLEYVTPTQIGPNAPFASTDYGPVRLGDKTFWLPAMATSSYAINDGKVHVHTTIHYSDYHQYTATSAIVPTASE